jgi:hypothetical protein
MNKTAIALAAVAIALQIPMTASAQLGGLLGGKSSTAATSGPSMTDQQDLLVRNYVGAGKDVLNADGQLSTALGLKAAAINASTTSDTASAKDIGDQDKAISAQASALSEALKSGATLKDDHAKAEYAKGLVMLASGVKKYAGMSKDAKQFSSGLSGASVLQLPKLQAGAYIVKNLPTSVSNLSSVLKNAVDFAKGNGVAVPADATSALNIAG